MNGNNQKLDAFSDLTLGSLDKYDERNRDAHKQKEADALDRRIRNFCERERNLEWANEAIEFCEKEKRDCVRLEGYSKEAHRLNDIRREAEKIIKEDKLYKEEMQKKLEQQAKEADDMILMLDLAPRNRYWAEEAKRVDAEIKNLPANLRLMLTNISLMDKLMKEIGYIEEGVKYDEIIHALRLEGVHDHKWAERMIEVGESIPEHLIQYMTEANELNSLKAEAKKIQADHIRAERERVELPIVRPYEKLIESYRTAVFDNVVITSLTEVDKNYYTFFMNNYKKLNGELGSLGFDPGDYISNFRSLWKSLGEAAHKAEIILTDYEKHCKKIALDKARRPDVDALKKLLEKLEQSNVEQFEENDKNYNEKLKSIGFDINDYLPDCAFRYKKAVERYNKEKEKRDRAEAERRAEIRRREEAKEAAKKKIIGNSVLGGILAICGALLIIGAVNFEHFAWFAGAAVAVAAILIPSVYLMILEDDFAPNWIIITIHSVLFAGAVIFLFVNPAVSFCLGIALALSYPIERMLEYITMSYVLNIYWSNTDEKLLWHYMTKTIAAPVGSSIVAISAAFIFFPENIMEAIVIGLSVGLLYGGLVLTIDDTGYSRFDRIRFAGILSLVIAAAGIVFLFINAFLSLCLAVPTIAMGIAMIAVKDGYDPEWLGTRKNGIVSLIAGLALLLVSIALIIVPMLLSGQIDNFFSEFSKNFL